MKKLFILSILFITCLSATFSLRNEEPVFVEPSQQRTGGDSAEGYYYLINGDYVKGGVPEMVFKKAIGKPTIYLERDAVNEGIPHDYTAVKAFNDEIVIAPNCLQCHAQVFEDKLYIGLGNSFVDFSDRETMNVKELEKAEKLLKTLMPKKWKATEHFFEVAKTIGPHLYAETRGVNVAGRLAAVLAAHHDPVTFKWKADPIIKIPEQVVPSDVPAWWLLKKKNGMFYTGFGRGDFGRFLMASNLLTVNDTSESAEVDSHMPDVLAYINSIQPPKFPKEINISLAEEGRIIFNNNCSACHGTYGKDGQYPNLLIPQAQIQTDSLLQASNYTNPEFIDWFNRSWFSTGDHPGKLVPFKGYIAPPLDGVWITAPYLHNGSIPTLEAVLNSAIRPKYWSRSFEKPVYNYENPGWIFSSHLIADSRLIYNTTLPGYGNYGHYFGDALTPKERKAVIEYLKTL